jgi:tRNA(Ile)-lysidine synthase
MRTLERSVVRTIAQYGMTSRGEKVLVAVSGGADSMALLHCLRRLSSPLRLTLAAAHLNHRLRGSESDQDEAFVGAACKDLDIPFLSEGIDVAGKAADLGQNLEETAREIRYQFLRRTAGSIGARKIAVGHTMNDQAETVLLRFLRGSGALGLSGIHPVVDNTIIRPLIGCTRKEILKYLEDLGVGYRLDSSNADVGFRRNRIREELIPYLVSHFNSNLICTLAREAELAREAALYVDGQAKAAFNSVRTLHSHLRKAVIRLAIQESGGSLRGLKAAHVGEIFRLCRPFRSGRRIELPRGLLVIRQFDQIVFMGGGSDSWHPAGFCYSLPVPGSCFVAEAGVQLTAEVVETRQMLGMKSDPACRVILDAASLPGALTVRSRLPGDRYGGPRRRKVKRMLCDAGVPLPRRFRLPMIAIGSDVIWVPGFKPAKPFIPKTSSGRYVILRAVAQEAFQK